jgi:hypothetical protein
MCGGRSLHLSSEDGILKWKWGWITLSLRDGFKDQSVGVQVVSREILAVPCCASKEVDTRGSFSRGAKISIHILRRLGIEAVEEKWFTISSFAVTGDCYPMKSNTVEWVIDWLV